VSISVKWIDRFREPTQPPHRQFPNGVDISLCAHSGEKFCETALPYPAKRCGYYSVLCETCGFSAVITTAGRPDDPKSVRLPCKLN
jgi:hypothetical protein